MIHKITEWFRVRRLWCNLIAAVVSIGIIGPLVFMAIDRTPPFTLKNGDTVPLEIPLGGTFQNSWEVKQHRLGCEGTVSVYIVDSQKKVTFIVSEPSYLGSVDLGTRNWVRTAAQRRVMPETVSVSINPEDTEIYSVNKFSCNWLQKYFMSPIEVKHPVIRTTVIGAE